MRRDFGCFLSDLFIISWPEKVPIYSAVVIQRDFEFTNDVLRWFFKLDKKFRKERHFRIKTLVLYDVSRRYNWKIKDVIV